MYYRDGNYNLKKKKNSSPFYHQPPHREMSTVSDSISPLSLLKVQQSRNPTEAVGALSSFLICRLPLIASVSPVDGKFAM